MPVSQPVRSGSRATVDSQKGSVHSQERPVLVPASFYFLPGKLPSVLSGSPDPILGLLRLLPLSKLPLSTPGTDLFMAEMPASLTLCFSPPWIGLLIDVGDHLGRPKLFF